MADFVPRTDFSNIRLKLLDKPPAVVTELCPTCPFQALCLQLGKETASGGWWGGKLLHQGHVVQDNGYVRTPEGEPLSFLRAAMEVDTDECQEWPYGCSHGYAVLYHEGHTQYARVVVCTLAYGPAPVYDAVVLHQPGTNKLCINRRHLTWARHITWLVDAEPS